MSLQTPWAAPAAGGTSRSVKAKAAALAVLICLVAGACNGDTEPDAEASPTPTEQLRLHANSPVTIRSIGPVVVGMNLDQISAAAGVALNRQPDYDEAMAENGCAYVSPATIPGYVPPPDSGNKSPLAFMIVDDSLVRIDILGGDFSTEEGLRVGSPESEVLTAYGDGNPLPDRGFIGPPYRYLTATPSREEDQNFRMVFESDGARVVNYRVGQLPQVQNRQGCLP